MSETSGADHLRQSATTPAQPPQAGDTLRAPPPPLPRDDQPTRPQTDAPAWEGAFPVLDGYEVLEVIGQGGMGVVFKARQLRLNRLVALKILHPGRATAEERLRFLTEAKLLARCAHPNVVQVFDSGTHEERAFLALEYVDGGTLAALTQGTPQRATDAAWLVAQIAQGVQHVHEQGVIHRDLKPSNVLLRRKSEIRNLPSEPGKSGHGSGFLSDFGVRISDLMEDLEPKVTDFGLARCLQSESDLTRYGAVMGTPAYMAPEQAAGRTDQFGPPLDVHALGTILYELLTGRPPFKGTSATETLEQVQFHEAVPPRLIVPGVPRDLETICLKCLDKEPSRRYATAQELTDDLGRWLRGEPIWARRVGAVERAWRWCRRRPSLAALCGVTVTSGLLLLGLAWWFTVHLAALESEASAQAAEARLREAEARQAESRAALHAYYHSLQSLRTRRARLRPGWTLENLDALAGLARSASDDVDLLTEAAAATGSFDIGPGREVARGFLAQAVAFSPDGDTLALGQSKAQGYAFCSVLLLDVRTGQEKRRLSFFPDFVWEIKRKVQDGPRTLTFSPDGRWLVVGCRSGRLHRWDLSQAEPTGVGWPGHADEIKAMLFQGDDLYTASLDRSLKRWDARQGWKEAAGFTSHGGLLGLTGSPTGDWVAAVGDGNLHVLDGRTLKPRVPAVPSGASRVALSPDGRVIFLAGDEQSFALDAVHHRPLRDAQLPLAEHGQLSVPTQILLSPDGTLAACSCNDSKHVRLWDLVGNRELGHVNLGGGHLALAFHPQGRLIAVTGDRKTLLLPLLGEARAGAVHPGRVSDFVWTPHGLWTLAGTPRGRSELLAWYPGQATPVDRHRLPSHSDCRAALAYDNAHGRLAVRLNDHTVQVWHPGNRVEINLPVHRAEVSRFGPDGRLWVLSGAELRVFGLPEGDELHSWSNVLADKLTGNGTLWALAVGAEHALVGSRQGVVRVLGPDALVQQTWALSRDPITALALSPDATLAAVGTWAGELLIVRVADGQIVGRTQPHLDPVEDVLWAGPRLAVTASGDATVQLWSVTDAPDDALRPLFQLPQPGPVRRMALAPDGVTLTISILGERGLRFWPLDRLQTRLRALGLEPGYTLSGRATAEPKTLPTTGLRLEVFEGSHFERLVKVVRQPQAVAAPDSSVSADACSLRWRGQLVAPKAGKYRLVLDGTAPARLWLDDKLLIDEPGPRQIETTLAEAPALLRLEVRSQAPGAGCRLLYDTIPSSGKPRPVPAEWLRP